MKSMGKKNCDVKKMFVTFMVVRSLNTPKFLLLLTAIFYFSSTLQSNNLPLSYMPKAISHLPNDEQWTLAKTIDKVDFYYIIKECKGEKTVFLKLNNKNKYAVKVSWKEVFQTLQKANVEGVNGKKEITLTAGQTLQGNCDNNDETVAKEFVIPSSKINPAFKADVSGYGVTDVSVSRN